MIRRISSGLSVLLILGLQPGNANSLQDGGDWVGEERVEDGVKIVRNISGSIWSGPKYLNEELSIGANEEGPYLFIDLVDIDYFNGRYYVVDFWAPSMNVYDSTGSHLFSVGGVGAGPGEFRRPDAIEIHRDVNMLFLRDLSLGRLNIYTLTGEFLNSWRVVSMYQGPSPMVVTHTGSLYSYSTHQTMHVMYRIERQGVVSDTLWIPRPEMHYQFIRVPRGSAIVPYSPTWKENMGPSGTIYSGFPDEYRIELRFNNEQKLIIERANSLVRISRAEANWHKQRITISNQKSDPGWTWNGPDIPRYKPAFKAIFEDRDGRIWVYRVGEGVRNEAGEWQDTIQFDVFNRDGKFLGTVYAPHGVTAKPPPYVQGDMLIAQFVDEDQVPYIRRYSIVDK